MFYRHVVGVGAMLVERSDETGRLELMGTLIRLHDAEDVVRSRLLEHYEDLEKIEVTAFVSALVNTFGLAALNAFFSRERSSGTHSIDRFEGYKDCFDFVQLPRAELLRSLEAASGLRASACSAALVGLEELVFASLSPSDAVELEAIGTIRQESTGSYSLELAQSQRVPAPLRAA